MIFYWVKFWFYDCLISGKWNELFILINSHGKLAIIIYSLNAIFGAAVNNIVNFYVFFYYATLAILYSLKTILI